MLVSGFTLSGKLHKLHQVIGGLQQPICACKLHFSLVHVRFIVLCYLLVQLFVGHILSPTFSDSRNLMKLLIVITLGKFGILLVVLISQLLTIIG